MKTNLNPNEWIVMNALWEHSPRTLSETIEAIGDKADWNYKTYQSYMVLLEKKGGTFSFLEEKKQKTLRGRMFF